MNVCIVSPKDILLIPQSKKRMTNKGPEPMECAIVTSSPYNLALEEEKRLKKEKLAKKLNKYKIKNSGKQTSGKNKRDKNKCQTEFGVTT